MTAYYNEFKPEAAHMLRQLVKDGIIAPGDVDDRSIVDVRADDLRGYTQCHFFAGIGGWSVALRLSGWEDTRPVWTGSCPCQPFSSAGKQEGHSDERHLWPYWFRLIRESKPDTIFGEQVASAIAYGWLDEVFNDLEAEDYACAPSVLPACSVGRPHKRDRLWFVANTKSGKTQPSTTQRLHPESSATGNGSAPSTLGNAEYEWIRCPDGKSRPVEPGICLLANGVQHRAPILHAFGNAIVPQVAQAFIESYRECIE